MCLRIVADWMGAPYRRCAKHLVPWMSLVIHRHGSRFSAVVDAGKGFAGRRQRCGRRERCEHGYVFVERACDYPGGSGVSKMMAGRDGWR
jgi:hypothetical protein